MRSDPLRQDSGSPRSVTIGMLRLTPPDYGKIRSADAFEASGGSKR